MRLGIALTFSLLCAAFVGCSHDSDSDSRSSNAPLQTELDDPREVLETSTRMNVTVDLPDELVAVSKPQPFSILSLLNPLREAIAAPVPGARMLVVLVGPGGAVTKVITEEDGLVVNDNGDGTYTVIMPGDPLVNGLVVADPNGGTLFENGYVLPDGTFYAPASGGDVVVSPESTVATRVVLNYIDEYNGISAEEMSSMVATLTRIAEGISAQMAALNMSDLEAQLTSATADYMQGALAQARQDLLFDASGYAGDYTSLTFLNSLYATSTGGRVDLQSGYLRRQLSVSLPMPAEGATADLSKLDFTYDSDSAFPGEGALNSHIIETTGVSRRALSFSTLATSFTNLPVNYDGAVIVDLPFESRSFDGAVADPLQLSLSKGFLYGSDQTVGGMFMTSRRDAFDAVSDGGETAAEVLIKRSVNFDVSTLAGNYGAMLSRTTSGGPLTSARGVQRYTAAAGVFTPSTQMNVLTVNAQNTGYISSSNPLASFGPITMSPTADADGSLGATIGGISYQAASNSDGRLVHAVAADTAGTSGFATFVKLAANTAFDDLADKRYVLYGGANLWEFGYARSGLVSGFLSVSGSATIQYINDSDSAEFSNLVAAHAVGASHTHSVFVNTQNLFDIAVNADGSITFNYDDHQVQGFVQAGGDLLLLHDVRVVGASGDIDHRVEDRYFYAVCFTGCKTTPDPALFTVGGEVQGLSGSVVLRLNNSELLTVSSSGEFTFVTPHTYGQAYTVDIASQPASQTCTVTSGTGVATSDIGSVSVACTDLYSVGGAVTGLSGTLGLQLNGAETLSLTANGAFTFATTLASGGAYSVAITTQPAGQVCSLTGASGTATSNVTSVAVNCVSQYGISGTLSGLASGSIGITLNAGAETITRSANGAFSFTSVLNSGASYAVTISSVPAGHTCQVVNGSGTLSAAVSNIQVDCIAQYTVGGNVTGLSTSVQLSLNGAQTLTVNADSSFTFPTALDTGSSYAVTVVSQPAGQQCTVASGSGTLAGNVNNVAVTCVNLVSIAGNVSSAAGELQLQLNGAEILTRPGAGGFTFTTLIPSGSSYDVTVATPPAGQTCVVANGSGTATASVTDIDIACSP